MADVNNDGVSDLIVGAGAGGGPRVRVFNGATNFQTTLLDFFAFNSKFKGAYPWPEMISTGTALPTSSLARGQVAARRLGFLTARQGQGSPRFMPTMQGLEEEFRLPRGS